MNDMAKLIDTVEMLREENRRLTNENGELRNQNRTLKQKTEALQKELEKLTQKNAGLEMMREKEMVETSRYINDLTRQVRSLREYFGMK